MRMAVIIVRMILGLIFLLSFLAMQMGWIEESEMVGADKQFREGLEASGYLMPTVKIMELLCAFAFLAGCFVPLATVVIFPITLNIFMYHLFLDPAGLSVGIVLLVGNLFLAYACRKHYRGIFKVRVE